MFSIVSTDFQMALHSSKILHLFALMTYLWSVCLQISEGEYLIFEYLITFIDQQLQWQGDSVTFSTVAGFMKLDHWRSNLKHCRAATKFWFICSHDLPIGNKFVTLWVSCFNQCQVCPYFYSKISNLSLVVLILLLFSQYCKVSVLRHSCKDLTLSY